MEWEDYVSNLLSRDSSLDGISLSINNEAAVGLPPIIKASILMLDRMVKCVGNKNIIVFPERLQSVFIFTLAKLLYNILEGRIEKTYNPESFQPGEKLRFGNAVFEFVKVEIIDGNRFIKIRLADLIYSAPVNFMPLFQRTTAKRISPYCKFAEAKRQAESTFHMLNPEEQYISLLKDYKTHMESSIVNMTSVINAKEMIANCSICGQSVKDTVLVGQADYEGSVRNIGAGQSAGIPAILLASDLYAIAALAQKSHPIQSIIIDGSNANAILSQMDALDELIRSDVPITCVTDVVNSFSLQPFLDRGFNLWRWDENSITNSLYDACQLPCDRKAKNCANRNVEYLVSEEKNLSTAMYILSSKRSEAQTLPTQMLKLFNSLYRIAFELLRETIPVDETHVQQATRMLGECAAILSSERDFLSPACYEDYCTVINCFKCILKKGYVPLKHDALAKRLSEKQYESICLIIPERSAKDAVQNYWQNWCAENGLNTQVTVLYPAEYYPVQCTRFEATVVAGWFKRAIMRKILYSFNTREYVVLLYDYEKRWKSYDTNKWSKSLNISDVRNTVKRAFASDGLETALEIIVPENREREEPPKTDEYAEIETVIRESKYRRYVAEGGERQSNQTADAVPVNFVGGYISFYRLGHKVISASNIIINDADRIDSVLPQDLKLGDFVVVREADKDLIREIADNLLEQSNQSTLRELATKWKEALQIETLFNTDDEIFERLKAAGCTRGFPTVRSWIHDEDYIAPQSKQDLDYIISVTENETLRDMKEQIFNAAQSVRAAHVTAGRVLSTQLRQRIVEEIDRYGDIDPLNIWEPIEMQIEGIGMVRLLKIIDIGIPVAVDISDTNRLIDEE